MPPSSTDQCALVNASALRKVWVATQVIVHWRSPTGIRMADHPRLLLVDSGAPACGRRRRARIQAAGVKVEKPGVAGSRVVTHQDLDAARLEQADGDMQSVPRCRRCRPRSRAARPACRQDGSDGAGRAGA
jgi:hypothetical protein